MYNQGYTPTTGLTYQSTRDGYSAALLYHSQTSSIETLLHDTAVPIQTYQSSKTIEVAEQIQRVYSSSSSFSISSSPSAGFTYETKVAQYFAQQQQEYHSAESFLKPYRPATQFIAEAAAVEEFVKEAFAKTTGEELPVNIVIHIIPKEEMQRVHEVHGGNWSDTIQGFSLNAKPYKQVFVKQAPLDHIMVVMGHEIGHVLTNSLSNAHDEEAKAFAFELAWVQTIMKHNIADLKNNLTLDLAPAKNGLHDIAKAFVQGIVSSGKKAIEVYSELAKRILVMENMVDNP